MLTTPEYSKINKYKIWKDNHLYKKEEEKLFIRKIHFVRIQMKTKRKKTNCIWALRVGTVRHKCGFWHHSLADSLTWIHPFVRLSLESSKKRQNFLSFLFVYIRYLPEYRPQGILLLQSVSWTIVLAALNKLCLDKKTTNKLLVLLLKYSRRLNIYNMHV